MYSLLMITYALFHVSHKLAGNVFANFRTCKNFRNFRTALRPAFVAVGDPFQVGPIITILIHEHYKHL